MQNIDKREKIMMKKSFVLNGEVVDVFNFFYLAIEFFSFHIARVRIFGSMECGKPEMIIFKSMNGKSFEVKERLYKSKVNIGVEIGNYH